MHVQRNSRAPGTVFMSSKKGDNRKMLDRTSQRAPPQSGEDAESAPWRNHIAGSGFFELRRGQGNKGRLSLGIPQRLQVNEERGGGGEKQTGKGVQKS